jgi:hypothetical protein
MGARVAVIGQSRVTAGTVAAADGEIGVPF